MNSNKLVLLDIFSYSCMNCLRSLEFIKKIDKKYKKYGLETILIHPPEWKFERISRNIVYSLKKHNIKFPIIIDKNKKIIRKLKVDFWPTQILIRNKKIIHKHIGEGDYKNLEDKIIQLLKVKAKKIFRKEPNYSKFPTVYCGKKKNGKIIEIKNKKLCFGAVYIDSKNKWKPGKEFLKSIKNNSLLTILTKGKIISFVAQSINKKPFKIDIRLNNKYIKNLIINKPQLYNLITLEDEKQHKLALTTKSNLAIYSFSFQ
ncbi:redoxin domain-containing protein [Candidatus Woesearchaeota archaeon]|nr:redoxin domain-containing protein [Candidatus Woesearchaeota archaeon]